MNEQIQDGPKPKPKRRRKRMKKIKISTGQDLALKGNSLIFFEFDEPMNQVDLEEISYIDVKDSFIGGKGDAQVLNLEEGGDLSILDKDGINTLGFIEGGIIPRKLECVTIYYTDNSSVSEYNQVVLSA
ncbi:MAG: hypothetical protein ACPG19_10220 [Saprospiraceae bacterium]